MSHDVVQVFAHVFAGCANAHVLLPVFVGGYVTRHRVSVAEGATLFLCATAVAVFLKTLLSLGWIRHSLGELHMLSAEMAAATALYGWVGWRSTSTWVRLALWALLVAIGWGIFVVKTVTLLALAAGVVMGFALIQLVRFLKRQPGVRGEFQRVGLLLAFFALGATYGSILLAAPPPFLLPVTYLLVGFVLARLIWEAGVPHSFNWTQAIGVTGVTLLALTALKSVVDTVMVPLLDPWLAFLPWVLGGALLVLCPRYFLVLFKA